jgi:hypothetical protein
VQHANCFGFFSRVLGRASLDGVLVGYRLAWVGSCLLTSLLWASACSVVVDPDVRGLGAPPLACEPGTFAVCACPGGITSNQRCNAGGGYDACQCSLGAAGVGEGE